jgi:hypothetical protein
LLITHELIGPKTKKELSVRAEMKEDTRQRKMLKKKNHHCWWILHKHFLKHKYEYITLDTTDITRRDDDALGIGENFPAGGAAQ